MSASTGHAVDVPGGAVRGRNQCVDQCRLADPGMSDKDGDPVLQQIRHRGGVSTAADADGGYVQGPVAGEQGRRVGQVGLGEDEQRIDASVVGRHQATIDQSDSWRWVGEGHDDAHLIGIGNDYPLVGVGVVGGAPQGGRSRFNPDQSPQCVWLAGKVADDADLIADHDRFASQFAGLDGHYLAVGIICQCARDAPSIHCDDQGRARIGVGRPLLATGPGSTSRARPDVVLVEFAGAHVGATTSVQRDVKSGSVFPVVAMFSTSTPGTTSPTIAANVAIR